ncbi:NAD(P) transhydrogenase subunit alpha part 1 [compost metagenome]
MKLGILKEHGEETRTSMVPSVVQRLIKELSFEVYFESGTGEKAGFSNDDYIKAGAALMDRDEILKLLDIMTVINPFDTPFQSNSGKILISIMNPLYRTNEVEKLRIPGLTVFSLDMLPRSTKAQAMDVLSSVASLSGYKAVVKAADIYGSVFPMFTTAAGTIRPVKVLIIGAGVAGLQAIATARRLGAIVHVFDVRSSAKEEVKSLGANFIEVEGAAENLNAGGYAIEQSEEFLERQKALIDQYVSESGIVISTANIPGKRAPLLIEKSSVEKMKKGSVIIDLASEQGGNCALTVDKATIVHQGVTIVGDSYLSRELAETTSQLLATNYFNFLKHYVQTDAISRSDDPILKGSKLIEDGEIVNERLIPILKEVVC